MIDRNRLREVKAELGFMRATTDAAEYRAAPAAQQGY
jgi:hypothetical protein